MKNVISRSVRSPHAARTVRRFRASALGGVIALAGWTPCAFAQMDAATLLTCLGSLDQSIIEKRPLRVALSLRSPS
jgi:hypothetical protein